MMSPESADFSYIRTATHCIQNLYSRNSVRNSIYKHTATHCNTLQHTATHCNTLQHTAVCCSVLHCVAMCFTLYGKSIFKLRMHIQGGEDA